VSSRRDKERADSHNSDDAGNKGAAGSKDSGSLDALEDLIKSEVLMDDDNAEKPAHLYMYEQSVMRSLEEPIQRDDVDRRTPSNDDYYPRVAISALMLILKDQSQSVHHSSVTQAIMVIFKTLGMHCVPFLEEILPYLLQLLRRCGPGLRESLLQQLSELAQIVQYHLAPYLPALFDIIRDYWDQHLEHILALVENIAKTASDAFSGYVTVVLPLLLFQLLGHCLLRPC
jgi:phosphatidylinositol kinase/protein kinase (PI-3  family)